MNLIPFNPIPGTGLAAHPPRERLRAFAGRLEAAGVAAPSASRAAGTSPRRAGSCGPSTHPAPPRPYVELTRRSPEGAGRG